MHAGRLARGGMKAATSQTQSVGHPTEEEWQHGPARPENVTGGVQGAAIDPSRAQQVGSFAPQLNSVILVGER